MNLLVIKTLTDGTIARSIVNYSSKEEAMAAFFYELWYATSDENTRGIVCEIITDDGRVEKCERYEKFIDPVVNMESEEEAE